MQRNNAGNPLPNHMKNHVYNKTFALFIQELQYHIITFSGINSMTKCRKTIHFCIPKWRC